MKYKYNKGDKVQCLKNYHNQFTKGNIYIISTNSNDRCEVLKDDNGTPNGWICSSFKLIKNVEPSVEKVTDSETGWGF